MPTVIPTYIGRGALRTSSSYAGFENLEYPTGLMENDLLLITSQTYDNTWTLPAGWTAAPGNGIPAINRQFYWWKVATGLETGTITIVPGGNLTRLRSIFMMAYRNVDITGILDGWSQTSSDTVSSNTLTTNTVTTTKANTLLIEVVAVRYWTSSVQPKPLPAGATTILDYSSSSGTTINLRSFSKPALIAGVHAGDTFTWTGNYQNHSHIIGLSGGEAPPPKLIQAELLAGATLTAKMVNQSQQRRDITISRDNRPAVWVRGLNGQQKGIIR